MQRVTTIGTVITLVTIAVAGAVDALRDERVGPALLFGVLAIGVLAQGASVGRGNRFRVGRDQAAWLHRTAPLAGESPEDLLDRAVSRLRASVGEPGPEE